MWKHPDWLTKKIPPKPKKQDTEMASVSQTPTEPNRNSNYYLARKQPKLSRAKFDFIPKDEGEIGFKEGDVIKILDDADEHWWEGEVNGKVGIFPGAYVEVVNN